MEPFVVWPRGRAGWLVRRKVILSSHPVSSFCFLCFVLQIYLLLMWSIGSQLFPWKKFHYYSLLLFFNAADVYGEACSVPASLPSTGSRNYGCISKNTPLDHSPISPGRAGKWSHLPCCVSPFFIAGPHVVIGVSSWSSRFPRAAGLESHCPVFVSCNNMLCFIFFVGSHLVNNGQILLNRISLAPFSIAQCLNSPSEKNPYFTNI